jgi:predicted MFS family arabinose efflux permease
MVVFSFFATPLQRMLPVYVDEVLHKDSDTFGLLTAIMGAGAVAGALALRLLPRWYPKHHVIPLSILAGALAITWFAGSETLTLAGPAMFVVGLFWLWTYNMSFAAMQLLVPDRMRGSALAVCNVAVFGAAPLGAVISGYVGAFVAGSHSVGLGTQLGIGLMSLALALAGIVMLTWRTPEVDGLKPGDAGYDRRPGLLRGLTGSAHRPGA